MLVYEGVRDRSAEGGALGEVEMKANAYLFEQVLVLVVELLFTRLNGCISVKNILFKQLTPPNNTIPINARHQNTNTRNLISLNQLQYSITSGLRNSKVISINNEFMQFTLVAVDLDIDFLLFVMPKGLFGDVGCKMLDLLEH